MNKDYENSLDFWNQAYAQQIEEENGEEKNGEKEQCDKDNEWKSFIHEKMLEAIMTFSSCENVIDYGCGTGWASVT